MTIDLPGSEARGASALTEAWYGQHGPIPTDRMHLLVQISDLVTNVRGFCINTDFHVTESETWPWFEETHLEDLCNS